MTTWNTEPDDKNNWDVPNDTNKTDSVDAEPVQAYAEEVAQPPSHGQPAEQSPMIRCEVTGKLVPVEDAVEFQGKMVSAEGKNILLRSLMGGQTGGVLTRPSFWRRLGCIILDNIIISFIIFPVVFVMTILMMQFSPTTVNEQFASAIGQIVGSLLSFSYFMIFHAVWGKTIGKMAGRFHVVKMDGSPITFSIAAVRSFWFTGIYVTPALAMLIWLPIGIVLSLVVALYALANSLALVTDSQYNRALHDRLAGTRVVMDD